jgi:hypothetical protein
MSTRVGFSTSKTSWVSAIIRWFTGGKSSHVFLVYWDVDFERDMVMEATQGGFKITPFSHHGGLVKVVTPKFPVEVGLRKAVDWLGEEYDYAGLLGMAWVELGRWLRRKWRNPWRSAKAMFCSEAVARVMQESSYPGTENWDPQSIDPEMLLAFFLKEEAS